MSEKLFCEARRWIPGGVNSPVRAFQAVGGTPIFFQHGKGPYLWASDNKRYTDYVCSWGAVILGHSHPDILTAVRKTSAKGLGFGAPSILETKMAKMLCTLVPSLEKIRLVNSGTEAVMSAIRLARGYTKRDKIVKCIGCYHGHVDSVLVQAGSGALTHGVPTSPGIPVGLTQQTLVLNYNDPEQAKKLFSNVGGQIAAVIVEPIAGNMNCVPATDEFLKTLRTLCNDYQSVLIFDEVMSGFRVALGGAQTLYNITPDLTVLGKVIGGGLPIGAFGGKKNIMDELAPDGPVYQAGTLSGNPVAMATGIAVLQKIQEKDFFNQLNTRTKQLTTGLMAQANIYNIPFTTHRCGGMFGFFFSKEKPITTFEQVISCDKEKFKRFFHGMLKLGVYLAPSPFEAGFISIDHTESILEQTINAAGCVMENLRD